MSDVNITNIPGENANNDITDFLLKEYDHVAEAFFNTYELAAKWIRYYLLIAAVPFPFIALIHRNKGVSFNLFEIKDNTLAFVFLIVGLLNYLISYIIIDLRLDSILYARTVNGVRKYFIERARDNVEGFLKKYIVLPIKIDKPTFYKKGGDLFVLVILMSLINSLYFSFGFSQLIRQADIVSFPYSMIFVGVFLVIMYMHFVIYKKASKHKESTYCTSNESPIN